MSIGVVRLRLREATAPRHQRVDEAFAHLDLSDAADYGRFLSAHARVIPVIERLVASAASWSGWSPSAARLEADLRDLGEAMPVETVYDGPTGDAAAWGAQYVVEGSRLGARLLVRQVADTLPRRYLAERVGAGDWRAFQSELDVAAEHGGQAWLESATKSALAAFEMFESAAMREAGPTV